MKRIAWHPKRGWTEDGVRVQECEKCPHVTMHAKYNPKTMRQDFIDRRYRTHNRNRARFLAGAYRKDEVWMEAQVFSVTKYAAWRSWG